MSMRFENSAEDHDTETLRFDSLDLDDFRGAAKAADDSNCRCGNAGQSGEKSDYGLVGLAFHWRRGDVQLPGVSKWAGEFGFASACADLKRESCFH